MKKLVSLLLVIACLSAFVLTGCGNNSGGGEGSNAESSNKSANSTDVNSKDAKTGDGESVELVVWESSEGPDEFIRQAGAKFTEQNPNITIKYVNVELGDTTTQIALDGPAGVGPDLFAAPHDKLGEMVTGGHVLATTNEDTVSSKVLSSCVTALTYDGKMYGYPVSAETYALFYNKDLISEEEVPASFEDLKKFCDSYSESGKYPFMMDVGNGYYTIIFTTSDNNLLFGPDGTDEENTNINSDASVAGMEFFQSLRSSIDVPAADLTTAIADGAFSSGNVAMYITGLWNVKPFEDAGINFGVTTLPSLPGETTPAKSFSGTRGMFVSAYSDHPEEAAAFGEFLLTEEMQQLRFELTGTLPAIDVEVDSPYAKGFMEQLNHSFPMPSIPGMGKYWDAMNAASANIWDGADVKTELDACNNAILG